MRGGVLVFGLVAGLGSGFGADLLERAGVAVVDITPREWPVALRGSFVPKLAESAHDPLHVRALVLGGGETRIAIAVVDSCMVSRDVLDEAKALAARETGIGPDRMLIAATHTHSAPFDAAQNGTAPELAYRAQLVHGISEAIVKAWGDLRPAEAGWNGASLGDEVFNRRWFLQPGTMPVNPFGETTDLVKMNPGSRKENLINPAGPTDPEVSVLALRDARGLPLALLANYPLHYVGNTGGEVSADYFGEFARLIGVRLRRSPESGFVGMLSNGTSGDINNINFRNPRPPREAFEQIRIVAGKVADAAFEAWETIPYQPTAVLDMVEREITLQVRVPEADEIARSRRYLELPDGEAPPLAKIYARRILEQVEMGETVEVKLQAVRVGDLAICAIPFEVLVEIGLELKRRSPFGDTFVMELANGAYGYLPTPEQHVFGGYETWLSTNKVEKDSSRIIVSELLEMLDELHMGDAP